MNISVLVRKANTGLKRMSKEASVYQSREYRKIMQRDGDSFGMNFKNGELRFSSAGMTDVQKELLKRELIKLEKNQYLNPEKYKRAEENFNKRERKEGDFNNRFSTYKDEKDFYDWVNDLMDEIDFYYRGKGSLPFIYEQYQNDKSIDDVIKMLKEEKHINVVDEIDGYGDNDDWN